MVGLETAEHAGDYLHVRLSLLDNFYAVYSELSNNVRTDDAMRSIASA